MRCPRSRAQDSRTGPISLSSLHTFCKNIVLVQAIESSETIGSPSRSRWPRPCSAVCVCIRGRRQASKAEPSENLAPGYIRILQTWLAPQHT